VIEDDEIKQLCKIFPKIKTLVIAAENILETKYELQGLENLENLKLEVIASEDYTGEVNEDEELNPDD
jgi:hypothetical protein